MNSNIRVKRLVGLAVAASIALAGFGLVSTAHADVGDATITLNKSGIGSHADSAFTAYLIGEYEDPRFDAVGDLTSVKIKPLESDALTAANAAATAAGASGALDVTNPIGWVAANWLGYTTAPTSDDTISGVSPYAGKLQVFAKDLATRTADLGTANIATGEGPWEFTDLTNGLYLIVDSKQSEELGSSPIIVGTQVWNQDKGSNGEFVDFSDGGTGVKPALGVAQLKNDAVVVGKSIVGGGKGYSIGDTVEYEVTFTVPAIPTGKSSWGTTIVDTFPDALDPPKANEIEIFAGADTTNIATKLKTNSVIYNPDTRQLTISNLEDLFAYDDSGEWKNLTAVPGTSIPVAAGTVIRIKYKATVNGEATPVFATDEIPDLPNNTNKVVFTDPDHTSTTGGDDNLDDAAAYVFGIDLEKVDKVNADTKLADAKFTVASAEVPDVPLQFVETESGVYRLALKDETSASETVTSRDNGVFQVVGLNAGEYIFTESQAPDDYFAVSPFTVKIVPTWLLDTQTIDSVTYVLGNSSDTWLTGATAIKKVTVADTKKSLANLPYTGSIGIAVFLIAGATITIIGVRAHRKSAKAETAATAI